MRNFFERIKWLVALTFVFVVATLVTLFFSTSIALVFAVLALVFAFLSANDGL